MSEPVTDGEARFLRAQLATESGEVSHYVRVAREGFNRYRAICACGGYRSKKAYFYPGLADIAGWDHAKAHGATRS